MFYYDVVFLICFKVCKVFLLIFGVMFWLWVVVLFIVVGDDEYWDFVVFEDF